MSENENSNGSSLEDQQVKAGRELKRLREEKGLTLKDISTATKINSSSLEALEEARMDELPAKSFTRGFIRAYAQYLKVDPKPIIESFGLDDPFITSLGKKESNNSESKTEDTEEKEEPVAPSKRISGPKADMFGKKPILIASIIVLILLIIGVKNVVDKYAQETVLPDSVKTESGSVVLDNSSESEESTETTNSDDSNSGESLTEEVSEPEITKAPEPTATPDPTTPPEPTEAPIKEEVKPTEAPKAPPKTQQMSILVEALDKVELEVQIEGESNKDIVLEPGSVYEIKTDKKVSLEISDGGLVNLIFNGRDRGIAGDLGQPAKVNFP